MPFPIFSVVILRKFAENKPNNLRKTILINTFRQASWQICPRQAFLRICNPLSKNVRPCKVCFELLKTFRVTPERPCSNRGVALQCRATSTQSADVKRCFSIEMANQTTLDQQMANPFLWI